MITAYAAVTILTATANAAAAAADLSGATFVLANAAEVGVPRSWVPFLAAPKALGAVGLIAGLMGFRAVGIAAAAGLVVFFACAVGTHVRARVFHNIAFPCGYLALAAAALTLAT